MSLLIETQMKTREIEAFTRNLLEHSALSGIAPLHLYILSELYQQDRQHASTLAKKVGRAATSFTPILDILEKNSYICRQADTTDRRAVFIMLTEHGRKAKAEILGVLAEVEAEFNGSKK